MNGAENIVPEPRPAASLTAGLLARRGGARPAMRRQATANLNAPAPINDDLGWNDMGDDIGGEDFGGEDAAGPLAAVPAPPPALVAATPGTPPTPPPTPIAEQLKAVAERINGKPARVDGRINGKPARAPAPLAGPGRKAAFTLRLDAQRHLRLRLLSAVTNRSAQQLLVEALDALIAGHDRLGDLARQVESETASDTITADMKWGS